MCFCPLGCVKSIHVLHLMYLCMLRMPDSPVVLLQSAVQEGLDHESKVALFFLYKPVHTGMPGKCMLSGNRALIVEQSHTPDLLQFSSKSKILCHIYCQFSGTSRHNVCTMPCSWRLHIISCRGEQEKPGVEGWCLCNICWLQ